ncbi:MAG: hypothetical protein JWQ27_1344 [Ferruginibacter sp.]|nr:hypothetical protein [Ferruginibacter sp.]
MISAAVSGFAQTPTFGVRAGLSSANLRGDAVKSLGNIIDFADGMITTGSRTGFFAGANASIPLGPQFFVEPGLYYSQKGYTLNGNLTVKGLDFLGANAKAQLQTNYLDIPVLLKANMGGLEVFAGPQFSYLMNANLKTTAGVLGFNLLDKTMDATAQFNRWDVGVTGGLGYKFTNGVSVSAAYDYGLSKINADKSLEAYNRAFKIGVGFNF